MRGFQLNKQIHVNRTYQHMCRDKMHARRRAPPRVYVDRTTYIYRLCDARQLPIAHICLIYMQCRGQTLNLCKILKSHRSGGPIDPTICCVYIKSIKCVLRRHI